jgi:hypothetical protein
MQRIISPLSAMTALQLALALPLAAQMTNEPPVVSGVTIEWPSAREARINYVVRDKDDKKVAVTFLLSRDNGKTWTSPGELSGDIGPSISTGKRQLIWKTPEPANSYVNTRFRVVADDGHVPSVQELIAQVDTARMRERLTHIAVVRDPVSAEGRANLKKVKDLVDGDLTADQFQVRRQPFTFGGFSGENIIARKTGTRFPDSLYVLCAAFDGAENTPAANNNGSGLAGLLEIADILRPYQFRNSVIALSTDYTGEEMIGSNNFVFKGGVAHYERVRAALDLDRVGTYSDLPNTHPVEESLEDLFPDMYKKIRADSCRANFIRLISNPLSRPLADAFKASAAAYVPQLRIYTEEFPGYGEFVKGPYSYVQFSDHICFWYRKYPAIWLTDAREGRRRDNTAEDKVNYINFNFLANVVKASLATFVSMAGIEHSGFFEGDLLPGKIAAVR